MLTPEQKKTWRRNTADGSDVTSEDADRASCYLAIVEEVRRTMLELCPAEKMYDVK